MDTLSNDVVTISSLQNTKKTSLFSFLKKEMILYHMQYFQNSAGKIYKHQIDNVRFIRIKAGFKLYQAVLNTHYRSLACIQ